MKRLRTVLCRITKWIGLVFCIMVVVVWFLSHARPYRAVLWDRYHIDLEAGVITSMTLEKERWYDATTRLYYGTIRSNTNSWIRIPCWAVFMCVAFPTALLFWRDRRRIPDGHCQKCGYNLKGNVSGLCPECGTIVCLTKEAQTDA